MESFYGIATKSSHGTLGPFQFVMILSILNGLPYGLEYLISDGSIVGYILLFGVLLSIFLILPFTLILSELSCIIPTNHGSIGYVYRGFYSLSPKVGDFIGFINALNMLLLYCIRLGITPILFEQYLQSYVSIEFTYWQSYLIMFTVILSGAFISLLNINILSNGITILIIIAIIPLLIGFFIITPQMSVENSLIGNCSIDLNISSFIVSFTSFFGFGYILIGNIIGEISFNIKKLPFLFILSIIISQFLYFIPFIATSTLYPSCEDWSNGLFITAYGNIWKPLYYCIEISSIICDYVIYIITCMLCGRLIWSLSQKYLLINEITGNINIENINYNEFEINEQYKTDTMNEYKLYNNGYNEYNDSEDDIMFDKDNINEIQDYENYRIYISILPQFMNKIWNKTGSPIYGILIQAIISSIICFINTNYYIWTEFLMFMYLFCFILIIFSFLILKFNEKNLSRTFGIYGAILLAISCLICIAIIGLYLVKEKWDMFIIAISINCCFVIYYIIWRICGCCYNRIKIVIKTQTTKLNKKRTSQIEQHEFEDSIADTIPLL